MPAISSLSCRSASANTASGNAAFRPSSAAAISCTCFAAASLQFGEPLLEFGDLASEALDFSIASVRCSSSGRGPRRSSGPGGVSVTAGPRHRLQHRARGACP